MAKKLNEISKKTLGNYLMGKEGRRKWKYDDMDRQAANHEKIADNLHQADSHLSGDEYDAVKKVRWAHSDRAKKLKADKERMERNSYYGTQRAVNRLQGKFHEKQVQVSPAELTPKGKVKTPAKYETRHKEYKAESVEPIEEGPRLRAAWKTAKGFAKPLAASTVAGAAYGSIGGLGAGAGAALGAAGITAMAARDLKKEYKHRLKHGDYYAEETEVKNDEEEIETIETETEEETRKVVELRDSYDDMIRAALEGKPAEVQAALNNALETKIGERIANLHVDLAQTEFEGPRTDGGDLDDDEEFDWDDEEGGDVEYVEDDEELELPADDDIEGVAVDSEDE